MNEKALKKSSVLKIIIKNRIKHSFLKAVFSGIIGGLILWYAFKDQNKFWERFIIAFVAFLIIYLLVSILTRIYRTIRNLLDDNFDLEQKLNKSKEEKNLLLKKKTDSKPTSSTFKNESFNMKYRSEKPQLKPMPSEIDLKVIIQDSYEWTLKVKRCFRPDEYSNTDIFIENIKFSKPRCSKCKANLAEFWHKGYPEDLKVIGCRNINCPEKGKEKYTTEYKEIFESIEKRTEGEIRVNFQKYWKLYCDEYNKITNSNYEEYEKTLPYS